MEGLRSAQVRKADSIDSEEMAGIERVVRDAKGRIPGGAARGFWEGKIPCWEMCHCPDMIKSECPAPKHEDMPCWEMEGTYCKLGRHGASGMDFSICHICRVYKRWGKNCPIELRLFGEGISAGAIHRTVEVKS
jgi:hypothetical protein